MATRNVASIMDEYEVEYVECSAASRDVSNVVYDGASTQKLL